MSIHNRILCVDDSADICDMLTTMLGQSNLEVIAVADTAQALHLMEHEQFSLYILDGQLPGVSGLSICEDIRKIDPKTPIIIYSGMAYQSDINAGLLAGANAYLVKPEIHELIPTVKRLLETA
jgi:OmpR-family two-component system manganese-sensing response regulator